VQDETGEEFLSAANLRDPAEAKAGNARSPSAAALDADASGADFHEPTLSASGIEMIKEPGAELGAADWNESSASASDVRIQSLLAEPTGDEWFTGQTSEEHRSGTNGHSDPPLAASGTLEPMPGGGRGDHLGGAAGSPSFEIEFDAALTMDAPLEPAKDEEQTADSLTSATRAQRTASRLKRRVPRP
jgi:hypothetical protein